MKKNGIFVVILGGLLVLLLFIVSNSPKEISWDPNYTRAATSATGTSVMRDYLDNMFGTKLKDVRKPVYELLTANAFSKTNFIFVNDALQFSELETRQLMKYVDRGNDVFLSAEVIGGLLPDTLQLHFADQVYLSLQDAMEVKVALDSANKPVINFSNPKLRNEKDYLIDRISQNIVLTGFDSASTEILGTNVQGNANFIRVRHGKGWFYIHTVPAVFANYFTVYEKTASCSFRALSYLEKRETLWDEYYKAGRVESGDSRRYILSQPALYVAWIILTVMLIIGMIFGIKRRERPLPVKKPLTNTTLEFVEVVGTLYLRQGNHNDIISKKINFFLESIRTRFFVKTGVFDEAFLERVSNLSGVHPDQVKHLFREIERIQFHHTNGVNDLKLIDQLIFEFNKQSKR